jgi:hypothetical protein
LDGRGHFVVPRHLSEFPQNRCLSGAHKVYPVKAFSTILGTLNYFFSFLAYTIVFKKIRKILEKIKTFCLVVIIAFLKIYFFLLPNLFASDFFSTGDTFAENIYF